VTPHDPWSKAQMLFVAAVVAFFIFIGLDFAIEDDDVTPRAGMTPAIVDLHRRMHRAREGWCAAWADKGKVQECKDQSLLEYREMVEDPLPSD